MKKITILIAFLFSVSLFSQQFSRPNKDTFVVSMTGDPNNTALQLYQNIDEVTASDTDFVYSADKDATTFQHTISNLTDPLVATGHIVRCRISKSDGGVPNNSSGSTSTVAIRLMQSTTPIATIRAAAAVTTWEDVSYTLSAAEANSITEYFNLEIEYVIVGGAGSPSNRRGVAISWAEMEVPSPVVATRNRVHVIN